MEQEVSQETQDTGEGVKASDKNNWEEMARKAQSKADKYEAIRSRYGDNFEDKLDGFSEFEKNWLNDPKSTLDRLAEQAGIARNNEPKPQNPTQEELNVWELGNKDSSAYRWLENQISTISDKKAQEKAEATLAKYKQEQQVNEWRAELANRGITDYKDQNEAIRDFLNPNPDFKQFLESKVSKQGNQQTRPSDVLRQVQHNQSQPKSTGVLQGSGMPNQPSWEDEKIDSVMKIAKDRHGSDTF